MADGDGVGVRVMVTVYVLVLVTVKDGVEQMFDIFTVETIVGEPLKLLKVALLNQVQLTGFDVMCMVMGMSMHPVNPGL